MALEKVSNILQEAEKRNTSAIAFDAFDYQTIYSCIMGAEEDQKNDGRNRKDAGRCHDRFFF